MDLEQAREEIAAADRDIAAAFVRRMRAAEAVAAWKGERGLPVLDAAQEERVVARNAALVEDPVLREYYVRFLRDTMKISRQYQHRLLEGLRIAYSGRPGAFAQIAAQRIFPDGLLVACHSFEEAYAAVESGACDAAVLPMENSFAGEVGQVTDLMMGGSLFVNGVYDLPVSQNLLGLPEAELSQIQTVISHPQALSQCESYLKAHGFRLENASNTAVAARQVAKAGDPTLAAIASAETADLYGLKVLDHDINESRQNTTRFAVFSRTEHHPQGGGVFLLLFTVKDEAGGLARAISVLGNYGVNMRVLRSRPLKDQPWHYYFYVEAEGDDSSETGRRMLEELREQCPVLRVVGHYRPEQAAGEEERA